MSDKRPTDNKLQKKDHRQIVRAKQLFNYRVQHFKSSYGPTVARCQATSQCPSSSSPSVDSLTKEPRYRAPPARHPAGFGRYPGTGGGATDQDVASPQRRKQTLAELRAEKQSLSQEVQAAWQAEATMRHIVTRNTRPEAEREEEDVREALGDTVSSFNALKESLLQNHEDLERQWKGLVGSEARDEKDKLRQQMDALQLKLNTMVGEQKRFTRDFQDSFRRLADDFHDVKGEMEASDALVREKQQQGRDHQALAQKFNTLVQKVKDMEEKLKATRTKFQQVHCSLLSNQKALAETTEEKVRVECELDSVKGEWLGQEHMWFVEKNAMAENSRNQMASMDRSWMEEREELFSEQKAITEHLFTAQNRGEDLDEELTATRTEMQEQRAALRHKEKSLEKSTSDNKRLKEDVAEKDEALFKFRKNVKAKDTEINELRNEVRELSDELDRLLDRKKKKFTLKGVIKKALQKTVERLITTDV